jgi:hypothetical protein
MAAYSNLHVAFEQMRVRALRAIHGSPDSQDDSSASTDPPRVLVLGPENSGKTTVCKILTNYAVRAGQDWSPLLINLDPSEVCVLSSTCVVLCHVRSPGRVVRTRRNIRNSRVQPTTNLFTCQSTWVCRHLGTDYAVIKRARSACVLVWPRRYEEKYPLAGQAHP